MLITKSILLHLKGPLDACICQGERQCPPHSVSQAETLLSRQPERSSRCSVPRLKVILKCPRGSVRQMPVHGKHHYTSRHPFLYPSVALEVSRDVAIRFIFEDLYFIYAAVCFFYS